MTTNDKKNFTASLLEKAARGSAKVAVNSRCMKNIDEVMNFQLYEYN